MSLYRDQMALEIIHQIAANEDVSPIDLPPHSTEINPELIESLPAHATLEFRYHGYMMTVKGNEIVAIRAIGDGKSASHAWKHHVYRLRRDYLGTHSDRTTTNRAQGLSALWRDRVWTHRLRWYPGTRKNALAAVVSDMSFPCLDWFDLTVSERNSVWDSSLLFTRDCSFCVNCQKQHADYRESMPHEALFISCRISCLVDLLAHWSARVQYMTILIAHRNEHP